MGRWTLTHGAAGWGAVFTIAMVVCVLLSGDVVVALLSRRQRSCS